MSRLTENLTALPLRPSASTTIRPAQVSATTRALESFAILMVEEQLQTCMRQATENGVDPEQKVSEISAAIARLVRS